MLKTWRNRLKIKNNDRFLSNTCGITLLHSIFGVLTINGNLYWKRGRIDLKSKRLNCFLVNNSTELIPFFPTQKLTQLWIFEYLEVKNIILSYSRLNFENFYSDKNRVFLPFLSSLLFYYKWKFTIVLKNVIKNHSFI